MNLSFLESKSAFLDSDYNTLFIRPYLYKDMIKHGNILYHAIKFNKIDNCKYRLNRKNNKYELYIITDNQTKYVDPIQINEQQLNTWTESFNNFVDSFKDKNTENTNSK